MIIPNLKIISPKKDLLTTTALEAITSQHSPQTVPYL